MANGFPKHLWMWNVFAISMFAIIEETAFGSQRVKTTYQDP